MCFERHYREKCIDSSGEKDAEGGNRGWVCEKKRNGKREREWKQNGREGREREGMIMSPTSDTSSCFYGDQGANHTALLRTVLLRADKRVERGVRRGSSLFMRANKIPVALQEVVSSCFPLNVEVTPGIDISKELVITEKKKKKKRKRGLSRDISFRALQDPTPHLLFHHQPHPP